MPETKKPYKKEEPALRDYKMPPQSIEAEQAFLGSVLIDKDAIMKVADIIEPEDFYRDDHGLIFGVMRKLFEKRRPIDMVTMTEELENAKKLEEIGGASYLTSLANGVPTAAHVTHYAEIIKNKSTLRKLIKAANDISGLGYNEEDDVDNLLDKAESSLFAISQKYLSENFIHIKDILAQSFDRIDQLHKDKGKIRGVPTGFKDLDNLLAGLQMSDLIILAARPSMGKTSFMLGIAEHIAIQEKLPVAIFSLEQSRDQLVDRMLSSVASVDSWKLRTGNLNDDDFPKIGYAMGVLSEAPVFIDDSPMLNVMELRAKARRAQMEHGLGLIIVDYLQLLEGRKRSNDPNRVQEVSEISRALKGLARELNVPVLALSQLSRAVEARHPKIPQLSDLRESGSLEQDSDVVMFIYREEYYDRDTDRKGLADILVRKHRNGPVGQIELYFVSEQSKFRSIEKQRSEQP